MKRIQLVETRTLTGNPFSLPKIDATGKPEIKLDPDTGKPIRDIEGNLTGEVVTEDVTSLPRIIEYFILFGLPREKYTNLDAIKVGNIYRRLKAATDGILEIDDDDYKWLKEKLKDDAIGVRMFTYNVPQVTEALDNFERAHESQDKQDKKATAEAAKDSQSGE